jgi:hypothetical protein
MEVAMRNLTAVIAIAAVVACNQGASTGPSEGFGPQFAGGANVSISGKGTATQLSNLSIVTEASFQCPDGELASITVKVSQASTAMNGVGQAFENCKDGPNTVVVQVTGAGKFGWDVAKAVATFTITTRSAEDSDAKEIMIQAP